MAKIVAIGNALVDSEFVVNDAQLNATGLTKGNMTLASHSEQADLIASLTTQNITCLLYTSPSPRDQRGSRMPSSA